jgi:hypothetical protein
MLLKIRLGIDTREIERPKVLRQLQEFITFTILIDNCEIKIG